MDMDTTKKKDSHEQILSAFANEEADILVGTQMIVKGHDFPKVTLVGALAADMSLYTDDYRSGERTFQLLTQAAGRAGRGDRPGEVVIQTYDPEHYAIEASAAQDYEAFYEKEIRYRSLMGYPPVENLMAVLAACEDEVLLEKACKYLKEYILRIKGQAQLDVIGPASPGVDKIKDIYRRVIYVKALEYRTLVVLKDRMEQYIEINSGFQKMRIQFDFNPMNLKKREERIMAIREVREMGDDVLEKQCKPVTKMTLRTKILIEDMLDTLYEKMGVGLAAPQVGILKQIVVIDVGEGPIVLINPEIVETSGEQTGEEGCLSVPGKWGIVTRPNYVKVRALNENMEEFEIEGEELLARAFCHEIDHLGGHLYVEKVEGELHDSPAYNEEDMEYEVEE